MNRVSLSLSLSLSLLLASAVSSQAAERYSLSDIDRELASDAGQVSLAGGPYISFIYGQASSEDSGLKSLSGLATPIASIEFDDGSYFLGAVGTSIGSATRIEIEVGHRGFDIDSVSVSGIPGFVGSGDVDLLSIMGNIYFDFPVTDRLAFFVGGGIGAVRIDGEISLDDGVDTLELSGREWVFAYQAMAGVSYEIADNVTLTGGYRLFSFTDPRFDADSPSVIYDAALIQGFEFGLRFSF